MIIMPYDFTFYKFMAIAEVERKPTILGKRLELRVVNVIWVNYDLPYMDRIMKNPQDIKQNLEDDFYTDDEILDNHRAVVTLFKNEDRIK